MADKSAYVVRAVDLAVVVDLVGVVFAIFGFFASALYLAYVVAYEAADVFRAADFGSDSVDERRVGDVAGVLSYEAAGVFASFYDFAFAAGRFVNQRGVCDCAVVDADDAAGRGRRSRTRRLL